MPQGFSVSVPSVHTHAHRVAQLGDGVAGMSGTIGAAGLPSNALGAVGASVASRQQKFVWQAQDAVSEAGHRLGGQASLLRQTGNNITNTDAEQAHVFGTIYQPGSTGPTIQEQT